MKKDLLQSAISLRAAVGRLGEQCGSPWWRSRFCDKTAVAFLAPVFPRTNVLSRFNGVSEAARIVHDKHIGSGRVVHLFRLPDAVEEAIFREASTDATISKISDFLSAESAPLDFLNTFASSQQKTAIGPVCLGDAGVLMRESTMKTLAALYLAAFKGNEHVYPYFQSI